MKRILFVCILCLLFQLPAAHAQDCDYDLTGQTIKFYHFGDLSGPYSPITLPVLAGFEDAVRYFNENGGVCGASIEAESRDTQASSDNAQAAWDDFTGRGDAQVIFVYLTDDAQLLREQASQLKIPLIAPTPNAQALYGDDSATPAYVFGATPLYHDQLGAFCDYISENWDDLGIEGEPVIGHLSWLGAFGEASDTPEARAYCEAKGVGYAKASYYFPGIPDLSPQITGLVDAGANILYTTSLAAGPAQLATTVSAMGLGGEVLLAGPNWVLDTSVFTLGGESVVGMIGQLPYVFWDESDHPGVQIVNGYWAQNRLADAPDPLAAYQLRNVAYLLSWTTVDWYRQFMTLAINDVGGDLSQLTGEKVYEVLISGVEFSALEGILTLSYSEFDRAPHRTRIGHITKDANGALVGLPLTDWLDAPDLIPNGADVVD